MPGEADLGYTAIRTGLQPGHLGNVGFHEFPGSLPADAKCLPDLREGQPLDAEIECEVPPLGGLLPGAAAAELLPGVPMSKLHRSAVVAMLTAACVVNVVDLEFQNAAGEQIAHAGLTDPTVQFATASQSVNENAGTFSTQVTLSAASAVSTIVPFTLGGTAVAGTNFSGATASPLVIMHRRLGSAA